MRVVTKETSIAYFLFCYRWIVIKAISEDLNIVLRLTMSNSPRPTVHAQVNNSWKRRPT